jgi:hypothetical protein
MSNASLPAELLLAVFRDVFASQYSICSHHCSTCRRIGSNHVAWGPTQAFNTADPALFPFALAAVTPRWRAVLSTVPEYWTRPVFFLDGPNYTPLAEVLEVLWFSRNLPIEVYITRRTFPEDEDGDAVEGGEEEAERMRDVMDALKPHLPRCQHIFIHTLHSSSLPSLRHDFSGHCPFLTQLKLESEFDDGLNTIAHVQSLPQQDFTCPAIYTLLIDGPNFREIALKDYRVWWGKAFKPTKTLIIRNLTTSAGAPAVPFTQALECLAVGVLSNLSALVLSNVSFDPSSISATTAPPPNYAFTLNMLVLSRTPFSFLPHFFRYTFLGDLYTICIESCTFSEPDVAGNPISLSPSSTPTTTIPNTFSLTLKDISQPYHLISLLRTWNGRRLKIISCPGFDDTVLEMMRSPLYSSSLSSSQPSSSSSSSPLLLPNDDNPDHAAIYASKLGCPNLSVLYLSHCTNFTPSALRTLIATRNLSPEPELSDDTTTTNTTTTTAVAGGGGGAHNNNNAGLPNTGIIELVTVTGDAPPLSDEERTEFASSDIVLWKAGIEEGGTPRGFG